MSRLGIIAAAIIAGSGGPPTAPPTAPAADPAAPAQAGLRELFPHVRADLGAGVVEVDAVMSPMLVKDERAPLFYLEVLACTPDTREHETLAVVKAKPSHVHAAMLAVGLKPGKPGGWSYADEKLTPVHPSGDRVRVRFVTKDAGGRETEHDPLDWVVNARDRSSFLSAEKAAAEKEKLAAPGWVFGGSVLKKRKDEKGVEREVYDADGSGTLIGLTTFGSETVGWSRVISPDAEVQVPEWVADLSKTPAAGSGVVIRMQKGS